MALICHTNAPQYTQAWLQLARRNDGHQYPSGTPIMIQYLFHYLLFLAEALTVVAVILLVLAGILILVKQARAQAGEHIEVTNLNKRFHDMRDALFAEVLPQAERKRRAKEDKRRRKARKRSAKAGQKEVRPQLYVLDFHGDVRASAVEALREEITAVLQVAGENDEVLLRLESAGGMVHGYGLAASQLARLRARGIRLVVAVDKVAASGGYMMACVAERIIAAPFAIVGSIGVVGQLPNFNRLLKDRHIDFELHTAGQYKRTLTLFGENTDEARRKFQQELEEAHALFKSFVTDNRPKLDVESVATGEHWFGKQALDLHLVDALQTSDDYLLQASEARDIYAVTYRRPKTLAQRLSDNLTQLRDPAAGLLASRQG